MVPIYDGKKEKLFMIHKFSQHFPPHLHESPEFVYVTSGTLELGINEQLFHMEKGDFAIVFPNMIHHYQLFSPCTNSALYIYPTLEMTGQFSSDLQKYRPIDPVIHQNEMHLDVSNAISNLREEEGLNPVIEQAYIQIILRRIFLWENCRRTFNRVFQDVYRMTPREYRNRYKERYLIKKNN